MSIRIRKSLEVAAEALSKGQSIPATAQDLMGKLVIPHWFYRLTGWLRWNRWAKRHGALKSLKRRPYLATAHDTVERRYT